MLTIQICTHLDTCDLTIVTNSPKNLREKTEHIKLRRTETCFALEANRGTCGIKTLSVIHRLLGDGATSLQDNL